MTGSEDNNVSRKRLEDLASANNVTIDHESFPSVLDSIDPLKSFRSQFHIPTLKSLLHSPSSDRENEECIYLCGNSLGLQPKETSTLLQEELKVWQDRAVNGHFDHMYGRPWVTINEIVTKQSADVVGAFEEEVEVMNSLTVNLHLLMCAFYKPTSTRYKILFEEKAFPSDHFALESQAKLHNLDPKDTLILAKPRSGEYTLRTEDILDIIEKQGDEIAVIIFSGVQYYTGQFFDLEKITEAGHKKGCIVGFDLAHAVGNVPLYLHKWQVDFACWCSYKYLNSGPGGIAGVFVHQKHGKDFDRNRLVGWWAHDKETRFKMENNFIPRSGAAGFQLSNPSVLTTVALKGSMNVFEKTSMEKLREKSLLLTGYLEYLLISKICSKVPEKLKIITPSNEKDRGCQLSLLFSVSITAIHDELEQNGIVCDKREPNVLRVAPVPLYNTFTDVKKFVDTLETVLGKY